jgi:hypothetical protein
VYLSGNGTRPKPVDDCCVIVGSAWEKLFELAVQYRRIAEPESPVLWLNRMPDSKEAISIMFIK